MKERRDISAVMVTIDRSPQPNYLVDTLFNLKRAGLDTSARLAELFVMDSGPRYGGDWLSGIIYRHNSPTTQSGSHREQVCANVNVADALDKAVERQKPWVLFLEDDIDVCAHFFDSVGAWLDKHAQEQFRVYPFGSALSDAKTSVRVHCSKFFGTQCFAIRSSDAVSLAGYLRKHCYDRAPDGTCYDLLMAAWVKETYPPWQYFLASSPSFVQHVGKSSVINPRDNVHEFPSWPGRNWSYA